MHNQIQEAVSLHIPGRKKVTPSGWYSFNAVCCTYFGESKDKRKRSGILFTPDGSVVYHCFNCKYKASWAPGRKISLKFKKLLGWLGMNDANIKKLEFEAIKYLSMQSQRTVEKKEKIVFTEQPLPDGFINFEELSVLSELSVTDEKLGLYKEILDYASQRMINVPRYQSLLGASMSDGFKRRLIIQFKHEGKNVGYTARSINDSFPKYLSSHDANFVFNMNEQTIERKFVVACEGPIDAMSIGGIAFCGNEISDKKAELVNSLNRKVIVVPDNDKSGVELIKAAIKYGWNISEYLTKTEYKDLNTIVGQVGKIQVLTGILKHEITNELKIKLLLKKLLNKQQ